MAVFNPRHLGYLKVLPRADNRTNLLLALRYAALPCLGLLNQGTNLPIPKKLCEGRREEEKEKLNKSQKNNHLSKYELNNRLIFDKPPSRKA